MQRCLLMFLESIKSEATRKNYSYLLDKFVNWTKLKGPEALLTISDKDLQILIEDYVFYMKKHVSPNSVPKYIDPIEHFLVINDRELKFKKIHKLYPEKVKESGQESYTTEQIQKMLSVAIKPRVRALILFLCSTGARIGALTELKVKDMVNMDSNCRAVRLYAGHVEETFGFLTHEANKALEDYFDQRRKDGEYINEESPVFRADYQVGIEKVLPCSKKSIEGIIYRILNNARIQRTKHGARYNIQADHGFRKWFKTRIALTEGIPLEISKKLIHHKDLEGKYTTPKLEELFNHFKTAIPSLIVDDNERLKLQTNLKDETIKKMESEKDVEIAELKDNMKNVYRLLEQYRKEQDKKS